MTCSAIGWKLEIHQINREGVLEKKKWEEILKSCTRRIR